MKIRYEKPEVIDFESDNSEVVTGASGPIGCVTPCTMTPPGALRSAAKTNMLLLDANGNPIVLKK
ncbi:MAG: hypothetical protein RR060_03310 [Victivallaceae bacterium]